MPHAIIIVCNHQDAAAQILALNMDLFQEAPEMNGLPSRLLLVPAGNQVSGRDGRSWIKPDPQIILGKNNWVIGNVISTNNLFTID
ncbi:MAG: hypothetical protein US96_C0053G0002 [Candidatus Woesebacteria bacterium GW2011_GWB1_38_5b]|uniref:Uncharacterized protein n=1 Tax=Candidatus Woesebacteria bacterium GW2011_GWB1_38_5b TaxID=1618569 RepID=A0A0G0N9I5_9BACT|nr:MAG: hypothetical protein US96_C0053G0002 [Candidatus Woesebacteria bacterium GW2011_GWB1_38_5b]